MKLRTILFGAVSLLAISASYAQAPAANGKPPVVNGVTIPQARLDFLIKQSTTQGQPDTPELRGKIREALIVQEILSQEAVKKGLDKSSEISLQMDFAKQNILADAYARDYVKAHPISDDALKAEYDKQKVEFDKSNAMKGDKEYKARHILVEKQDEAKDIIAKLHKGEKFEKLAEKSKDPGSKANGGELGWNSPATFVKPFGDAMMKLKKGETTKEPVQTQFGWHVIRLEDVREAKPQPLPGFDQVKSNLSQHMQRQQIEKMIAELKTKAKVE